MNCLLDTCVFNWLLDGDIVPEQLPTGARYFITHIQHDELSAVASEDRRRKLLDQLHALQPTSTPTESMVVGISRVGACKVSDGVEYSSLLAALQKKKRSRNNPKDALIGEAVLKNGFTLVSADRALCEVMKAAGAMVVHYEKKPNQLPEPMSGLAPGHDPS